MSYRETNPAGVMAPAGGRKELQTCQPHFSRKSYSMNIEARTALERHIIKQIRWLFAQLEELRNMPAGPAELPPPAEPQPAPLQPAPVAPAGPAALPAPAPEPAELDYMRPRLQDAAFLEWRKRQNSEAR